MKLPSPSQTFFAFIGGTFLALALFLIGFDIYRASHATTDWAAVLREIQSLSGSASPIPSDEVQNFALFSEVKYGDDNVVTGTEYSSTHDQRISKQWCYVTGAGKAGDAVSRLSLARTNKNGVKTIPRFRTSALQQFDLTYSSVRALINSHCRFK